MHEYCLALRLRLSASNTALGMTFAALLLGAGYAFAYTSVVSATVDLEHVFCSQLQVQPRLYPNEEITCDAGKHSIIGRDR